MLYQPQVSRPFVGVEQKTVYSRGIYQIVICDIACQIRQLTAAKVSRYCEHGTGFPETPLDNSIEQTMGFISLAGLPVRHARP